MNTEDKSYDYDPENGNDYTIDDHGNIIYGKGYIGAKLLPKQHLGLSVDDFITKYLNFEEKIRLEYLYKESLNSNYYFNLIICFIFIQN
jgi:hypothetical protein